MVEKHTIQQFTPASGAVDPAIVPYKTLYTGTNMPVVGLGSFSSDRYKDEAISTFDVGTSSIERSLNRKYNPENGLS